jgi:hypothetical protein
MPAHPQRPAALPARSYRLPSIVRARVVPCDPRTAPIERVEWLTPYSAETIGEDARRAGRGSRLELYLAATTSDEAVEAVRTLFGWLHEDGIIVVIRQEAASCHD